MTKAEWDRAGVYREAGVYTFVIKKTGTVTVYLPGDYRTSCSNSCSEDFTTTFRPTADRLTLGSVPVCSFKGLYSWHLVGRTLIVRPSPTRGAWYAKRSSADAGSADERESGRRLSARPRQRNDSD